MPTKLYLSISEVVFSRFARTGGGNLPEIGELVAMAGWPRP